MPRVCAMRCIAQTRLPSLHPHLPAPPERGEQQQPGGCQQVDLRRAGREIHPRRLLQRADVPPDHVDHLKDPAAGGEDAQRQRQGGDKDDCAHPPGQSRAGRRLRGKTPPRQCSNSAVARTPASQAAGSWRSTGRAEEKTIWEVLFFRSRLPISDQMASGHSQAMGSRYGFVTRERAAEDGDIQPGSDGPPPPAAAVEQQAQLGKQHPQEGVHLGQF